MDANLCKLHSLNPYNSSPQKIPRIQPTPPSVSHGTLLSGSPFTQKTGAPPSGTYNHFASNETIPSSPAGPPPVSLSTPPARSDSSPNPPLTRSFPDVLAPHPPLTLGFAALLPLPCTPEPDDGNLARPPDSALTRRRPDSRPNAACRNSDPQSDPLFAEDLDRDSVFEDFLGNHTGRSGEKQIGEGAALGERNDVERQQGSW